MSFLFRLLFRAGSRPKGLRNYILGPNQWLPCQATRRHLAPSTLSPEALKWKFWAKLASGFGILVHLTCSVGNPSARYGTSGAHLCLGAWGLAQEQVAVQPRLGEKPVHRTSKRKASDALLIKRINCCQQFQEFGTNMGSDENCRSTAPRKHSLGCQIHRGINPKGVPPLRHHSAG